MTTTFPLILQLSSRLPKDLGDPLLTASILWWNAHITPLTERWWNGFGFFPATGMMALSEHFLGASLIASPLQWLGCSPVTAHNVTFLASFPLCAIATHALALTLTRRNDAAFVCGLAYGFNLYRVAHVEHLELLLAFGMPAALAALHLYVNTYQMDRGIHRPAVDSGVVQQLLRAVLYRVGWLVDHLVHPAAREWRQALVIVAAGAVSPLVVWPIAAGYVRITMATT